MDKQVKLGDMPPLTEICDFTSIEEEADMSVICKSHVDLVRVRKSLEKALAENNWCALREHDLSLTDVMNAAFEDTSRNSSELVIEMERVLRVYARMVASLPSSGQEAQSLFSKLPLLH